MEKLVKKAPIWVKNPDTQKDIDVSPFIEALNTFDRVPGSPANSGGLLAIRRMLRLMNLTIHDHNVTSPGEVTSIYHDLCIIEDMFDQAGEKVDSN